MKTKENRVVVRRILGAALGVAVTAGAAVSAAAEGQQGAISARFYSQEGLALHLDGIENAGLGVAHDSSATIWKDLSPEANDAALTATGSFGDNGLIMSANGNADYAASTIKKVTAGSTVECLVRPTGGDSSQRVTVLGGAEVPGDAMPFPRIRMENSQRPLPIEFDNLVPWRFVPGNGLCQFAIRSTDGENWTAFDDGRKTEVSHAPKSEWVTAAKVALGGFAAYQRRLAGTMYTVRVYDHPLSALEIKANAMLDHVRFEGADPETTSWPEGFQYFKEDNALKVHVVMVAEDAYSIALGDEVPLRKIDSWIDRGQQVTLTVFERTTTKNDKKVKEVKFYADAPCCRTWPSGDSVTSGVTASDYARNGLVLQYDGLENAGVNSHDYETRVWKDLSSSENDGDLMNAAGEFVAAGLKMSTLSGALQYAMLTQKSVESAKTIECVICPTGVEKSEVASIWGGYPNPGDVPAPRARLNNSSSAVSTVRGKYSFNHDGGAFAPLTLGETFRFAFVNTKDGEYTAYVDGVSTGVSYPHEAKSARMTFGGFKDYSRRVDGVLYAVRAYDRVLSDEELKRHALFDQVRFGALQGVGYSWDKDTSKLQVEVAVDCGKYGVVTVNGEELGVCGTVKVDYGSDVTISVSGKGGKFTAWSGDTSGLSDADLTSKTIILKEVKEPRSLVAGFERAQGIVIFFM